MSTTLQLENPREWDNHLQRELGRLEPNEIIGLNEMSPSQKVFRIAYCENCHHDIVPDVDIWCLRGYYYVCPLCRTRGNITGSNNIFGEINLLKNFTKPFRRGQRFSRTNSSKNII